MNHQLIIGLAHKAQQGKDMFVAAITAYYANLRETQHKHGLKVVSPTVQRIGFADALYDMCRTQFGMTVKDAPLLQRVGQKMRENHGENFWFDQAIKKVDKQAGVVLFSDARYLNEARGLQALGGYIVDLQRYNRDGSRYIAADRPADHPSEIQLDGYAFDFILANMHGHQALFEEQAITLVHYLRALKGHK